MKTLTFIFLIGTLLFISGRLLSQVGSPITNYSATPKTICPGESVQFTDMTVNNPTSWKWTFYGGSPATSTLQNPVVVFNFQGNFNVILQTANEKGFDSKGSLGLIKVMACNNISEFEVNYGLHVYPNPVQSYLNIISQMDMNFTMFNSLGLIVLKGSLIKDGVNKFNIENLPSGIYILSVQEGSRTMSYKLVKD